jgi:hypothetical protein
MLALLLFAALTALGADVATAPFSITIAAKDSPVRVGEPLLVDILLRNTSSHDIHIGGDHEPRGKAANYAVDIRDTEGNLVPKKIAPPPKLPPGLSPLPETFKVGSTYGETLAPGKFEYDNLRNRTYQIDKPGQYIISLQRTSHEPTSEGTAKSNTLVLTVTN